MNVDIVEKLEKLIAEKAEEMGFELVDLEVKAGKKTLLKIFMDKPGGINIEDLAMASRRLEPVIDEHELIKGSYELEVSSPGLERPLKSPKDFKRHVGSKAKFKFKEEVDKEKVVVTRILDANNDEVTIEKDEKELKINYDKIKKANLVFDFGKRV